MAPNDKKDQKTEVTSPAPAGATPDFGDRIGRLESRVIVLEQENTALKNALSEQGAELKELGADFRDFAKDTVKQVVELRQAIGSAPSSSAMVLPVRKDKVGEVPPGFFRNARGLLVAEEYRGEKKYELSETAFVGGTLRQAGERIVVVDEQPGKTWRPLVAQVEEKLVAGPLPTTIRAADRVV